MDLSRVIVGQVVTEKAEAQKANRTYTIHVAPQATKVDIKAALKHYYDVDAVNVRVINTVPKYRTFGRGRSQMQKRARFKKALITLDAKSKALDIASFKS